MLTLTYYQHCFNIQCPPQKKSTIEQISESNAPNIPPCTKPTVPPQPNKISFTPTVENVLNLELYVHSNFSTTAVSKLSLFPSMPAPPAHIHLKSNEVPYAKHTQYHSIENRKLKNCLITMLNMGSYKKSLSALRFSVAQLWWLLSKKMGVLESL